MGEILEQAHPGSFYFVTPYGGYRKPECSAQLEAGMNWPKNVLIAPVRGTRLEATLMRADCMQPVEGIDPPVSREELSRLAKRFQEIDTGVAGDALLYLAPAAELMQMPADPTIWMDVDYYQELRRRFEIRHGEALWPLSRTLPFYAAPPRRWSR